MQIDINLQTANQGPPQKKEDLRFFPLGKRWNRNQNLNINSKNCAQVSRPQKSPQDLPLSLLTMLRILVCQSMHIAPLVFFDIICSYPGRQNLSGNVTDFFFIRCLLTSPFPLQSMGIPISLHVQVLEVLNIMKINLP